MEKNTGRREFVGTVARMAGMAVGASFIGACAKKDEDSKSVSLQAAPSGDQALRMLKVEFGGLCMLVHNPTGSAAPSGFYALMPATKQMDAQKEHCPFVAVEKEFTTDKTSDLAAVLDAGVVDLHDLNKGTAATVQRIPGALRISEYGRRPIDTNWLTASPSLGSSHLVGRIWLPANIGSIGVAGNSGNIKTANGTAGFYGRVTVEIPVDPPRTAPLTIGGITIVPDSNGEAKITFLNVRESHLQNPSPPKLGIGQQLMHQRGYYGLLKGGELLTDPELIAAQGPPKSEYDSPEDGECEGGVRRITLPVLRSAKGAVDTITTLRAPAWIEPVQCTIGEGCVVYPCS